MSEVVGGISGSALNGLIKEYDTISHNLANMSTVGYKRKVNSFSRELLKHMDRWDENYESRGELNTSLNIDFTQGSLIRTGDPMDVAIKGPGFFVLETPDGPLYTRNGVFQVNPLTGQLTDSAGKIVAGAEGPVIIPNDVSPMEISIGNDGIVSVHGVRVGKIRLVEFGENKERLTEVGHGCFSAPEGIAPSPATETQLDQGFRENSNVMMMEELTELISANRLYDLNTKVILRNRENTKEMIGIAKGT